ncbi:MAG: gluconokinase [Hyphomicrobiaceae bacterium]
MLSKSNAYDKASGRSKSARRCRSPEPLRVVLLMGVSGAGKSTLGEVLATELGWPYRDADSFHPEHNIHKMSQGLPLTDDDRWPWLQAIADWVDSVRARDERAVVSCSALKRVYRDLILVGRPDVRLVYLKGDKSLIRARMIKRQSHFMPAALLDSQFDALEEPVIEEWPIEAPIHASPRRVAEFILAALAGSGASQL